MHFPLPDRKLWRILKGKLRAGEMTQPVRALGTALAQTGVRFPRTPWKKEKEPKRLLTSTYTV